ncbi:3-hydroxyacyl-CoA dehydrogenase/enoyl-CoA hydratase family protein [Chthonomonas calidirosea]|uniref:3-hydroxyacyl-CoA dehydrogenase/enoyl-CoA hydratase family protein n=1 Tax=Chthonomonas calidirosea TaxID=454171 RepID=UPI0006ECA6D9|nr:3-hydroxyacyl-CoA dehydrogenase/enoyl-CoA hydratase family protein [Chthonomonas calidirosea]CEK20219.1 3-hydroxyacyl-CoA dehydrogenase [Chthonomonas calidirosea]
MIDESKTTGIAVVLGAGTMGGGIAAQLANAGWMVWLLDLPSSHQRNQLAEERIRRLQNARPPLLALPEYAERIHAGNIEDDIHPLKEADWIVEAVMEDLETKRHVLALADEYRGAQTLITSNTSGLSLHAMSEGRSDSFRGHFFGTHFLNPPRYLKLLEIVPLSTTDPSLVAGFARFAEQVLGHRVAFARDTPGFISTRLWIEHLLETMHLAEEFGLSVETVDRLTGSLIGRPRSATFRMADIVGLDIVAAVARHQYELLPNDPKRPLLTPPKALQYLLERGLLGEKRGSGFYRRQNEHIEVFDPNLQAYRPRRTEPLPFAEHLQTLSLPERLAVIGQAAQAPSPEAQFLHTLLSRFVDYVAAVGPEIADDILTIDRVMQWGFQWELGPGAIADLMQPQNKRPYYRNTDNQRTYLSFLEGKYLPAPKEPEYISLSELKQERGTLLADATASLITLDDDVVCLEFHTKMNTFEPALVRFIEQVCQLVEKEGWALVIGNQAAHFSAGYNLRLFLEAIEAKKWRALDIMLKELQFAFLRLKYASFPTVAAPHGYTLGAGCEGTLHCAYVQAARELAMGLPEVRVGLIPAGGGTKEMLARTMSQTQGSPLDALESLFKRLTIPSITTSADEARKNGLLRSTDGTTPNADRLLYEAKCHAKRLREANYRPPSPQPIPTFGRVAKERLHHALEQWFSEGLITEHDRFVAGQLARVLYGDTETQRSCTEEELLQLEREAFVEVAKHPKSLERVQHVLNTGKHLRN